MRTRPGPLSVVVPNLTLNLAQHDGPLVWSSVRTLWHGVASAASAMVLDEFLVRGRSLAFLSASASRSVAERYAFASRSDGLLLKLVLPGVST